MATRRDTRSFSDTETSNFPKMGDDGMASVVNMSGNRSAYTMPVGRKGPMNDDIGGGATSIKGSSVIHEAQGPRFAPVATSVYAGEYAGTERSVHRVPSRTGVGDFWTSRATDNGGEVIG
jgi:hypothetical protein